MPSRNIIKQYSADSYYHVYNRGVEKRKIFLDNEDNEVFLSLFERHLGRKPSFGSQGRQHDWLIDDIEVVSYCLMPNHFHLLLFQIEPRSVIRLLRAVCSSYVSYFNKKYDRVGPLFQGKFRAIRVTNSDYLMYLTRYIHRNPKKYLNWEWSSLKYWINKESIFWVKPQRLNDMTPNDYLNFITDDSDYNEVADIISEIVF